MLLYRLDGSRYVDILFDMRLTSYQKGGSHTAAQARGQKPMLLLCHAPLLGMRHFLRQLVRKASLLCLLLVVTADTEASRDGRAVLWGTTCGKFGTVVMVPCLMDVPMSINGTFIHHG